MASVPLFHRVPEAILIAIVTTVCIYLATVILGTCVQFSDVEQNTCSVRIIILAQHKLHCLNFLTSIHDPCRLQIMSGMRLEIICVQIKSITMTWLP